LVFWQISKVLKSPKLPRIKHISTISPNCILHFDIQKKTIPNEFQHQARNIHF
jgi:hypothetical protein